MARAGDAPTRFGLHPHAHNGTGSTLAKQSRTAGAEEGAPADTTLTTSFENAGSFSDFL